MKTLKSNISKFFKDVKEKKTEAALYAIASEGMAVAKTFTPVDTSTLINSEFPPIIKKQPDSTTATVGFNAEYAFYVHEKSGSLKGVPRKNGNGYYWSPDAEPKFLAKGFDEIKEDIPRILKAIYDNK